MSRVAHYDPFDGKLGFALASRIEDRIHVSGMTGFEKDQSVPESIEAQMRLAYGTIARILKHYGLTLEDVVEQVIFFVGDAAEATSAYDQVRPDVFPAVAPSSTMVGATALVDPRYKVEIKVIAAALP